MKWWKIIRIGRGRGERCAADSDCGEFVCKDHRCRNPCLDKVCASNTECTATNHVAICSCKKGYNGHPLTECSREESCTYNAQCDSNRACREGKCVNPCLTDGTCKDKRNCRVESHVASCWTLTNFDTRHKNVIFDAIQLMNIRIE